MPTAESNGKLATPVEDLRATAAAIQTANAKVARAKANPVIVAPHMDIADAVAEVKRGIAWVKSVVIESDDFIDALARGTCSQTHVFVCGPGGIGKTFGSEKWAQVLGLSTFYTVFRPDMKREEVFGPLSITGLTNDVYQHVMDQGYAQDAEYSIWDEMIDGGRFNRQLLRLLNEREFVNGALQIPVPLLASVGATNFMPTDPVLDALMDRFPQRLVLDKELSSEGLKSVLRNKVERRRQKALGNATHEQAPTISREAIGTVLYAVETCAVPAHIYDAIDELRLRAAREGLDKRSPRRWEFAAAIAQADAVLGGSDVVTEVNLRVCKLILPNSEDEFDPAAELCAGFRDPLEAYMATLEPALRELEAEVRPHRERVAAGTKPDSAAYQSITTTVPKIDQQHASVTAEIEKAKAQGRDASKLDAILAKLDEDKTFLITTAAGLGR